MPDKVTVALVQNNASGAHADNIEAALKLMREGAGRGAELIALPEYVSGFGSDAAGELDLPVFLEREHPALAAFASEAQRLGVFVHVGSLAIRRPDGRTVNRGFVLDNSGAIIARYDKIHLFDVDLGPGKIYRESNVIAPGDAAVVAPTPWGGLGMSICYDLRFAALYRALAQGGAGILAVPAAFTKTTGEVHWHTLMRARAIETGSFVVAPCQFGSFPGGGQAYGHSLIVDPWGKVLADGGEGPGIVSATLDLGDVARARGRIPALQRDRPFRLVGQAAVRAAE